MAKKGFIVATKSRGKTYFYIMESYRDKNDHNKSKNKTVYSLGRVENSIDLINSFIRDRGNIPVELQCFCNEDFEKWLSYINNKITV